MEIIKKLNSILNTKQSIKTSIESKGVEILDTDNFNIYPEKIDDIDSGDVEDYFEDTITDDTSSLQQTWQKTIKNLPAMTNTGDMDKMYQKFEGTRINLSKLDFSKATNMSAMFSGCYNVKRLNLRKFDTSKVTNMSSMFQNCKALTTLDVSSFDTSQVTDMGSMFNSCSSLTNLDLSNFDTSQVTNMRSMFGWVNGLTELKLDSFNTSQVTNMASMFVGNHILKKIDMSSFDTSKVTNMSSMFLNCYKLEYIDMRNADFTNVTSYANMFGNQENVGVLNNCLIIVKDNTAKEWITSKTPRLINVKTVAEYESLQD